MEIKVCHQMDDINPQSWNRLVQDNNPFLKHEWLAALEHQGCVGAQFGWLPRHIVIYVNEQLVAAMPLYEKYNSYGEFVFDHPWADAYQRQGLAYYPKLVSSIPYSPVSGQRLLILPEYEKEMQPILLATVKQLASHLKASSFHCLFPKKDELDWLDAQGCLIRHDCQFHWPNHHYQSFDDFLLTLSAKKRKNIRQERRRVEKNGIQLRVLDGNSASDKDWKDFAHFYNLIFEEKTGTATFNEDFFKEVAKQLPKQVVLVLADKDGECIAGSLMYCSDTTLYGRHWGTMDSIDCLHFEACYYQGIEYCIKHNIRYFEPGAQGEHKLARGFLPTLTRSAHWMVDDMFVQPIKRFIDHEQSANQSYIEEMTKRSPYK